MSVGIIMLVHTAFDRAEQVARHWAAAGCPLVIHADKSVPRDVFNAFAKALSDLPDVRYSKR
ncbi:MAG: glycosyl transferase, partial [Roseovarius gahaiensis]